MEEKAFASAEEKREGGKKLVVREEALIPVDAVG